MMIQFDASFFEGETRSGFYIEPMMKRAWAASLEVWAEVDRICKKHNIQYFADWGTLLGTVRDKGFIAWDDDIDIVMKRPDYQKFLQIAPMEFEPPFELINFHTDKEWSDMLTRVINGRAINLQQKHLERFHGCPYAVGIDIFPLDFVSRNPEEDQLQLELVKIVLDAVGTVTEYETGKCSLEEMVGLLAQIENLCNVKFDVKKPLDQQLRILGDRLCMIYQDEDADEIGMPVKRITNRPYYHMPKEYYSKSIDMPYENIMMPVPIAYDEILKMKYGDNYMIPRHCSGAHNYPFYRSQKEILERILKEKGCSGEQFGIKDE